QDPNEVVLLRITREILEKAEREQSEKKLDSIKQSQDKIRMEEKGKQQQEDLQEVTQKRKIEEREPSKNLQDHAKTSQEKNNEHVKNIREVFKRGNLWIEIRERDFEWDKNEAKINEDCCETEVKSDNKDYLTIWDLPTNINKKELEYICRRFKETHIAIPVNNNKLVWVTKGEEDHEAREKQRKYTAKLTELPGNASEVLLLEMKAAQSKLIMYNNFRVHWINREKREIRREERFREERGRSWDRFSQISNIKESEDRRGKQKSKTYMNKPNNEASRISDWSTEERNDMQDHNTENQARYKNMNKEEEEGLGQRIAEAKAQMQGKGTYVGDILGRILERLERLEEATSKF
ncbi:2956_t:CDS:2, partial [Paraglomus occultum]